jgi:hypothetical protein
VTDDPADAEEHRQPGGVLHEGDDLRRSAKGHDRRGDQEHRVEVAALWRHS